MRKVVIGLSALALGGCTATISEPGQSISEGGVMPPAACDAVRAEAFIGQNGQAVAERARIAAGAKTVRLIAPGQAVTHDYRIDRLNISTGESGLVVGVSCG